MSDPNSNGIYLDSAASSAPSWANSHSIHKLGFDANKEIKAAEKKILDHINGHDGVLLWTGSGSQANNLAIRATCCSDDLMTTAIEHKSILQWKRLAKILVLPERAGHIDPTEFILWSEECVPRVASCMWVNNETGVVNDIATIGQGLNKDIYFHVDAAQALGKFAIDVEKTKIDMLTLSAHKVYGPTGLGCLWVRNKCYKDEGHEWPYLGTLPVSLISQFGFIVNEMSETFIQQSADYRALKEHKFLSKLKELKVKYHANTAHQRLVGHLNICFSGIDQDELIFLLSDQGVYISTGSACESGKAEPSHVLTAMSIPEEKIKSTVRITFGNCVSEDQAVQAAEIIAQTIRKIKNGS